MEESNYIAAIIGGVIGIVGSIVGAIISYKYAFGLVKETKFIDACVEFKLAFSWIIQWLNEKAIDSPERTFGKLHESEIAKRHEDAISRFRVYLDAAKQIEFDRACIKFYNEKNNHRYEGYVKLDSPSPKEDERNLALANINQILEFAKY